MLHRRVAEILRDRFPDTAAAEPEVLAHHFTQAALTDAAIEWWGKAGDQALRRSAFQEAISHLGNAIEMADKTGEGTSTAATTSASANQQLKIQTDLGKALMFSRGFGAEESKAAFIRARELPAAIDNPTERFTIYFGLWLGNMVRGELRLAREIAETFLREAERGAWTTECGFGRRLLGSTCLWQGDFIEAQANLVEALNIYDPKRVRGASSGAELGLRIAGETARPSSPSPSGSSVRSGRRARSSKKPSRTRSKLVMYQLWSAFIISQRTSRWFAAMLKPPGATQKFSSNSAKRMRLRSLQLGERCNPLG